MELSAVAFIGLAIIGATQFLKHLMPNINGAWTIAVSVALGGLVALFDTEMGLDNITLAVGLATGLGASGAVSTARNVGLARK